MTSWRIKPSGISKSSPMSGKTGVTIVDENGDMNVNSDTSMVATHLRLLFQLRGLLGSFGPSQVIYTSRQWQCHETPKRPTMISSPLRRPSSMFSRPASYPDSSCSHCRNRRCVLSSQRPSPSNENLGSAKESRALPSSREDRPSNLSLKFMVSNER